MSQEYGVLIIILMVLIWGFADNDSIETYKADELVCTKWDESKAAQNTWNDCLQKSIDGSYRIAINKSSGGCAVLYDKSGIQSLIGGLSMSYINADNWECKLPATATSVQKIYWMDNGTLSIFSTYYDFPARSDGIWGNLSHYWRIADQYVHKHS